MCGNIRQAVRCIGRGNLHLKPRGANSAEGANDLVPHRATFVNQNLFVLVLREIGIDAEGLDVLPVCQVFLQDKAVDQAVACRIVAAAFFVAPRGAHRVNISVFHRIGIGAALSVGS